jgi:hypothetical protein
LQGKPVFARATRLGGPKTGVIKQGIKMIKIIQKIRGLTVKYDTKNDTDSGGKPTSEGVLNR